MAGFGGGLAGLGPNNRFHEPAAWVRRPRAFYFRLQTSNTLAILRTYARLGPATVTTPL
jgi:hypothetical protein